MDTKRDEQTLPLRALTDRYGFLKEPDRWSKAIATQMAESLHVGRLGKDHWRVVQYLREHHRAHRSLPVERVLCHDLGLHDHCVHALFGGRLEAWKIAGLPDPGEEARTYMESEEW